MKHEYEAALVREWVTLKDEYLKTIENRLAGLRRDYLQTRQKLCRWARNTARPGKRKINSIIEEYQKTRSLSDMLKQEYESAFEKLNLLKERFPEKLAELQALLRQFQADLVLVPAL